MRNVLSIFLIFIISLSIFNFLGKSVMDDSATAEEFALGLNNTAFFPTFENIKFHCSDFDYFPIKNCIDDFLNYPSQTMGVLYTGNSQLHGINQPELGLNSTTKILYKYFNDSYVDKKLITFSIPNMNLQEQLVLNIYAANYLNISHLIIAASFDNTRETSIRESIQPAIEHAETQKDLLKLKFGKKIVDTFLQKDNAGNNLSVDKKNLQQRVENILDRGLATIWPAWDMRSRLRFRSIVEVYQFRNRVFGITPNSIRKKIPARYSDNLDALKDLLSFARDKNLKVIVYSPPIRGDQTLPYDLEEFKVFKSDLKEISESRGFDFFDFQDVVPSQYWGYVDETDSNTGSKEIDFMHFQGKGHEFLAEKIVSTIESSGWMQK